MSLTIEQILAAQDSNVEPVKVPEWGGTVYVRRMSAATSIDHVVAVRAIEGGDAEKARARLAANLAAFLCDENGKSLATIEQARQLVDKSAAAVMRIVEAGSRLNATDDSTVEAQSKKSEASPDDTSPTA